VHEGFLYDVRVVTAGSTTCAGAITPDVTFLPTSTSSDLVTFALTGYDGPPEDGGVLLSDASSGSGGQLTNLSFAGSRSTTLRATKVAPVVRVVHMAGGAPEPLTATLSAGGFSFVNVPYGGFLTTEGEDACGYAGVASETGGILSVGSGSWSYDITTVTTGHALPVLERGAGERRRLQRRGPHGGGVRPAEPLIPSHAPPGTLRRRPHEDIPMVRRPGFGPALVAAVVIACSSSTSGATGGYPTCQGATGSTGPGSVACTACLQNSCGAQASSVQSNCGAYLSCYEGCQCSDLTCIQGCLGKIDSTCENAEGPLATCLTQDLPRAVPRRPARRTAAPGSARSSRLQSAVAGA